MTAAAVQNDMIEKRTTRVLVRFVAGRLSLPPTVALLKMRKTETRKTTLIATVIPRPVRIILFRAVIVIFY